jgi:hypothetical protein
MAEIHIAEQNHTAAGTRDSSNPAYQAYQILHIGFIAAPIVAGLDKFLELLAEWTRYLWPGVPEITGLAPETFMGIVGGIEILAGLIVAFKPRIGGYIVSAWLLGIIVNLLLLGDYYDIALRDLGLALGALALARLATAFQRS